MTIKTTIWAFKNMCGHFENMDTCFAPQLLDMELGDLQGQHLVNAGTGPSSLEAWIGGVVAQQWQQAGEHQWVL